MASIFSVPAPIVAFNAHFPLKSYPPIKPISKSCITAPTLWVHPPRSSSQAPDNVLSADVECLKWQAYLALRGLAAIKIRMDIAPEGSLDGSLPNLHVPTDESLVEKPSHSERDEDGRLLAAHTIPAWVDEKLGVDSAGDPLEGYKDQASRVESRAWVSLLEGIVHAALVRFQHSSQRVAKSSLKM
jgi:metaxin